MFSIAQVKQSSSMFYNFQEKQIEWGAYRNNRNENHSYKNLLKTCLTKMNK